MPAAALVVLVLAGAACTSAENRDGDAGIFRITKRPRQPTFKPEDFTFAKLQADDDERDGLFATCLHVPMYDQHQRTWDCAIGITLPLYVVNEKWPRTESDAARYVARAFNALRKDLKDFVHADEFTCGAYRARIRPYLNQGTKGQGETWTGADTMKCAAYQGASLPDFYFRRGHLLIGDYVEWAKYVPAP